MTKHYGRAALGVGLIILALIFPTERLAALMMEARPDDALLGLDILRACLALNGVLTLAWAALPANWFHFAGLSAAVTGLNLGPEGWPPERQRLAWRPLLVILSVGTALRLIGLNQQLWLDEVVSVVYYMRLSIGQIAYTYTSPNQHLLYSVLGSLSLSLFGESAWAARLPALLFGVGSLAGLYYMARAVTTEGEALWATALMAVSYHHVWFSQNARGYTGNLFWSVVGTGLFLRGLAQNRTLTWAGYVASIVLGILTLQNTIFVFLSHVTAYVITLPRWRDWRTAHWPLTRRVFVSALLVALFSIQGYSLLLPNIVEFFRTEDRIGLGSGISTPVEFVLLALSGLRVGFVGAGLVLILLLIGSGWWSYWRQSPLVAGLLVLPPAFGVLAIIILNYGAFPRAFLYVLPLALLFAVRGAFVLAAWLANHVPIAPAGEWLRRLGGVTFLGLVLLASLISLIPNYRTPKQNYIGALAYVEAQRGQSDVVAAVGLAGAAYQAYYAPGLEFPATAAELAARRGEGNTTWVIYTFQRDMRLRFPELYDYIERDFTLVASFPGTVGDGTMWVTRAEGR